MKHVLLLSLVFATSAGMAAEPATMKSFIAKKVIVLDRPLTTFHYRSWNYDPKSQAEAWGLVRDAASNFWKPELNKDPNAVGPGFYTSVDSAATRSFGNEVPQLYAVTLKKGARILDSRFLQQKESDALKEIGAAFNCFRTLQNEYPDMARLRVSESLTCQAEYLKAMKELKVDAIMYGYSAANNLENCRSARDVALNIVSTENIDDRGVAFYSPKTRLESDAKEGSLVYQLFKEGAADPQLNRYMTASQSRQDPPGSLLKGPEVSKAEYEKYKATYIWKCGEPRTSELTAGDRIQEQTAKLLQGGGYQTALNEMEKAYQKRFHTTMPISAKELRGLMHLQYRASKMANNDSKWKQWLLAMQRTPMAFSSGPGFDPEKQLKEISDLFEEKYEALTARERDDRLALVVQNFVNPDVDYFTAYPGAIYALLKTLGAGPRLTGALANSVQPIPIVIGPVPKNPQKNYTDYIFKNRDFVVRYLGKCTDIYNDPRITDDQVLNGECGSIATDYLALQTQPAPAPTPAPRQVAPAPIYPVEVKILERALNATVKEK